MGRFKNVRTLLRAFTTLIVVNFVFNLHHSMVSYVNSSLLGQFFSPEAVSILYVVHSIIILGALLVAPALVGFIGTRTMMMVLIPLLQFSVLFLGLSQDPVSAAFYFTLQGVIIWILFYILDLYLEEKTLHENETGGVRAAFLTAGNIATFFAPLLIAFFVLDQHYPPLYAFASILLTPAFALTLTSFKRLQSKAPQKNSFAKAIQVLRHCKPGVSYVIAAQFLLRLFFVWVVVYVPLYLIAEIGLTWQVVGTMTALALFAYILLEVPLGFIADRYLGEKEIMITGFIIMGVSTSLLSLIPLSPIFFWGVAFFFTRVGAAMVEISTEAHFFKKVDAGDATLISIFRIMHPLGFIVGPLIALVILPFTGLQFAFGFFGVILLIGVPIAMRIVDTK